MNIYAISDLHLEGKSGKLMDMFGDEWINHPTTIAKHWDSMISDDDVVVVCGDFSWARSLEDTADDMKWLGERPGTKIMIKGNHDHWWQGIGKVREAVPEKVHMLQNDSIVINRVGFCGTRYWVDGEVEWPYIPSLNDVIDEMETGHGIIEKKDEDLLNRELNRLELSLESMSEFLDTKIALMHFPPVGVDGTRTRAARMLENYNIDICVFGHIHAVDKDHIPELSAFTFEVKI